MSGLNVKVRDLVKVHHTGKIEVQALRGLSMDVDAGEMIAIMALVEVGRLLCSTSSVD